MLKHCKHDAIPPGNKKLPKILLNNIDRVIERDFGLDPMTLTTDKSTRREISLPRSIAIFIEHKSFFESTGKKGYRVIAMKYGMRHTSVIYAIKKCDQAMANRLFQKRVFDIQLRLFGCVKYINHQK